MAAQLKARFVVTSKQPVSYVCDVGEFKLPHNQQEFDPVD